MHILDKPLDLPEQGADKVLSGASKVGRRDRGHAKNPVFSQFLLSDGTPLITSKSVCQQPVSQSPAPYSHQPGSESPNPRRPVERGPQPAYSLAGTPRATRRQPQKLTGTLWVGHAPFPAVAHSSQSFRSPAGQW